MIASHVLWPVLDSWQTSTLVYRFGSTLLHGLWQGAIAAVMLKAVLGGTRGRAGVGWSNFRYAAGVAAMGSIVAAAVITFVLSGSGADGSGAAATSMHDRVLFVAWPAATSPAVALQRNWILPALVFTWFAGVLLLSVFQFAGWLRIQSWRREPMLAEPRWQRALAQLAARMKISRLVALVGSTHIDVPMVIGAFRPAIIVPLALANELAPHQIQAIIAHELAHIRRHDYLVNLIQAAIETIFFHHPAMWWISAQIRVERENCCDDLAASLCGGNLPYAKSLVVLEERRAYPTQLAPGAADGNLLRRIRRLVAAPTPPAARRTNLTVLVAVAVASIGLFAAVIHTRSARADEPPAQARGKPATAPSRIEHRFVNVTIGKDNFIAVEGGVGNWNTLHDQLAALSSGERASVVIRIKAEFGDVPVADFFAGQAKAQQLVDELGLAYVSNTGIDHDAVPLSGEVYVGGAANRTGPYSITGRHVSVRQMLISAGGVTENRAAWISIIRRSSDGETHPMKDVSVDDLMNGRAVDLYLQANDIMMVSTRPPRHE